MGLLTVIAEVAVALANVHPVQRDRLLDEGDHRVGPPYDDDRRP